MFTRRITYLRWLLAAIPLLCSLLLWTTTTSTAYPCLRRRNYLYFQETGPIPELQKNSTTTPKPQKLKGPLWCTATADPVAVNNSIICKGETLCSGTTACDGTFLCSEAWIDDGGTLACGGELLCHGTLTCSETLPAACLPGLGIMPAWALAFLLGFLILVSGLITGCTAAFTSLDSIELSIYTMEETKTKKKLSEKILKLKNYHTSWVISCLLMCSVTINLSLPLISACLLDNHLWGLLLSAGLLIVVGEILPQVIFPRYPVTLLGNFMWFIYIILAIYSLPAGILVFILHYAVELGPGKRGLVYDTKQLIALIDIHTRQKDKDGKLSTDSVRVIQGALDFENKVAKDIMKPISGVKMLDIDTRMNIDRWTDLISWGHSRIPVYSLVDEDRGIDSPYQDWPIKIWGYLHSFDMMSLVLEEATTLRTIPIHELPIIAEDYPLWDLLHMFQEGISHIAIVERAPYSEQKTPPNSPKNCLPRYTDRFWEGINKLVYEKLKLIREIEHRQPTMARVPKYWTTSPVYKLSMEQPLGIVTMEDVLEALLKSPILDEKDISHLRRRMGGSHRNDMSTTPGGLQAPRISQEFLASRDPEDEAPVELPVKLVTRAGNKGLGQAATKKNDLGNKHLSPPTPLVPVSSRDRRRNASTDPSAGTPWRNNPERLPPKDKGKGIEVRKAASENNYSTSTSSDFELESWTGTSAPSSLPSTGTIAHFMDILGLASEYSGSSASGLTTLDEESSASVHSI